jgi:hypothetical protein
MMLVSQLPYIRIEGIRPGQAHDESLNGDKEVLGRLLHLIPVLDGKRKHLVESDAGNRGGVGIRGSARSVQAVGHAKMTLLG